jgi:hypothetical protein
MEEIVSNEKLLELGKRYSSLKFKFLAILSYIIFTFSSIIILLQLSEIGQRTLYINGKSYSKIGTSAYVVLFFFGFIVYLIWNWNSKKNAAIKAYKKSS